MKKPMTEKDYLLVFEDIIRSAIDYKNDQDFLGFLKRQGEDALRDLDKYRKNKLSKRQDDQKR